VYGLVTMGALLAAESGLHETYPEAIGSVMVAMGLYWLVHAYSDLLGSRLTTGEHLTVRMLGHVLVRDWAIVRGAGFPLLALLISWAAGAAQETAVEAALWTTVACLVGFELMAGLRGRASVGEVALEIGVGVAMGLAILALRAILH
jgi:hypothetical protein